MRKSTHSTEYKRLCAELVNARTKAGLSQRDLASALRVAPSWVAKVEIGERRIDVVEFGWLLTACKADPVEALQRILTSGKAKRGGQAS